MDCTEPVSNGQADEISDQIHQGQRLDVQFHAGDAVDNGGAVGDEGHVILASGDALDAGLVARVSDAGWG